MQTDAEIISAFRDFMAKRGEGPATFVPLQNHPLHRGVMDAGYVRPAPTEFPKMIYHPAGMRKIVKSREEQDAEGPTWSETPPRRSGDWKAKLNEVYTKSGFRVYKHHVEFLQAAGVGSIETFADAAVFLDKLDDAEQEQFFREAEDAQQAPVTRDSNTARDGNEPPADSKKDKKKAA